MSWSHTLRLPSLTLPLKMPPWSPLGSLMFWAWAAPDSLSGSCSKRCTFLHHNPVSVDWLYCTGEWTQVWFGHSWTSISPDGWVSVFRSQELVSVQSQCPIISPQNWLFSLPRCTVTVINGCGDVGKAGKKNYSINSWQHIRVLPPAEC